MQFKKFTITLVNSLALIGCSFTSLPGTVKQSINNTNNGINAANQKLDSAQSTQNNNYNYDMHGVYFSNQPIARNEADYLPPNFNDALQIDATFYSMSQIADTLNKITKYPVLLDTDSIKGINLRVTQNSGNLIDLLNNICAKTDTSWSFKNGSILLSDTQTQTWFINGIPGDIQVQNQVNSNSGIQGQSGGSGATAGMAGGGQSTSQSQTNTQQNTVQNIQYNLTNSLWDNMQTAIKTMLSKKGTLSIIPATSSVTVTDKPSIVIKVGDFIHQQNAMLKRQVQIDVQVLSVETSADDNYGINWNLALKGSNTSFTINGQAPSGSGGTTSDTGGITPVFTPTNTTQSFSIGANSGSLSGSQLIINALSSIAKTSMITSTAATTLNNQPVPVQIVEQQGYVSNVSTTQVLGAGAQQSITTGQINYGFVLNILPVIEDNGLVNLQISMNLSSLKALNSFGTTGNDVQLPDMIQRNTMQKTTLRNGDTYVITGFDSDYNQVNNSGVGGATNWLFGGGVSASNARTKLVILVTPRIVNI